MNIIVEMAFQASQSPEYTTAVLLSAQNTLLLHYYNAGVVAEES